MIRKIIISVFGLLIAATLAFLFYQRLSEEAPEPPQQDGVAVAVEVAPLETGGIRNLRIFTGSLSSRSNFDVVAKARGQLASLKVDIGDTIERNQVIGKIDDEEFLQDVAQTRAELEVAHANLEEARTSLELAERERDRVQALRERRITSAADLDAAEAAVSAERSRVRVAEATIEQREAALRAAELRLSYTDIVARWDGEGDTRVVGERYVEEGATVTPDQPVLSLVDLNRLRAVVLVTERDYEAIRIGQEGLVLSDALPGEKFEARVTRRAPQFRETSRQARVELDVPNRDERLRPGQFVRVQLELGRAEEAIIAPRAAIIRRENAEGLFLIENNGNTNDIARFVPVQSGYIEDGRIQILEPGISGDVVVLGQNQLADGTPVRIVRRTDADDVETVAPQPEAVLATP